MIMRKSGEEKGREKGTGLFMIDADWDFGVDMVMKMSDGVCVFQNNAGRVESKKQRGESRV